MNQSGLKEPGFQNRRMFSKKGREPYYAFKNLRLPTFPNHGLISKLPKELEIREHRVTKAMLIDREQNFQNNQLERIVSQQTNCNSADATKRKRGWCTILDQVNSKSRATSQRTQQ